MRRVHLRQHPNILKRLLVHVAAFNLGLVMRKILGRGTPRGLQGYDRALFLTPLRRLCAAWLQQGLGKTGFILLKLPPAPAASRKWFAHRLENIAFCHGLLAVKRSNRRSASAITLKIESSSRSRGVSDLLLSRRSLFVCFLGRIGGYPKSEGSAAYCV